MSDPGGGPETDDPPAPTGRWDRSVTALLLSVFCASSAAFAGVTALGIQVFDLTGRAVVSAVTPGHDQLRIGTSGWSTGIHTVRAYDERGGILGELGGAGEAQGAGEEGGVAEGGLGGEGRDGLADHPLAKWNDDPGFLGNRDEFRRRQTTETRMVPAHQRLEPRD